MAVPNERDRFFVYGESTNQTGAGGCALAVFWYDRIARAKCYLAYLVGEVVVKDDRMKGGPVVSGEGQETKQGLSILKISLIAVLAIVTLAIFALGAGAYYVWSQLQPVYAENNNETKTITIPQGASSRQIGMILEENGLIRDAGIFSYYVRYKQLGSRLQAGDYRFSPGESIDSILQKMVQGETFVETFHFTIPEGYTVEQIADRLASQGLVNKEVFLKEVNEGTFSYDFVNNIPDRPEMKYRLEGYLFPKTYQMKKGASEHEIIDRMLAQFASEVKAEWQETWKQRNITLHEAVTLASIIEREVRADQERAKVAGVYYNRLAKGMLLQADATIQFIFGKQKEVVTYADLEIDHPYNTYLNPGLPPGPVASPGRAALEATAMPEKHNYLYYVTKKDGSGEHFFAETFAEHQRNIAKSKK